MDKTIFNTRELKRICDVAYDIITYAEMQNPPHATWQFKKAVKDTENPNLYRAEFDIVGDPKSELIFTCQSFRGKPDEWKLIRKTYTTQSSTNDSDSRS